MGSVVTEKNITAEVASAIRRNASQLPGFTDLRKEALEAFERIALPGNKSEEYKHTPLTRLLEKNFNFAVDNTHGVHPLGDSFRINGIEAITLVFLNGKYRPELSVPPREAHGLTIAPLSAALHSHAEIIAEYLGKTADFSTDAFVAWNTAAWTDGVFIHVEANKRIDIPVFIYHLHDTSAGQVVTAVRNLVIVEKSAEVTILEKQDTIGEGSGFSTLVSEGIVGANAALNWYSIQNDPLNRYHAELRQIKQANASRVNTFTFTLDGKAIRNNLHLALDGEGIDSHMYGLYLLGKDTLADNHTVVDHRQPHSFSNELYKGVMDDKSHGVFNGKIYVRPNAQKTNAFQANRNILLSDQATVNTKPQLEIWADDVKCSHGCTSGQLDEEALFYLRTRGIHEDTARAMVLYAFAAELLEPMKHEGIKHHIDSLISERLHKNF